MIDFPLLKTPVSSWGWRSSAAAICCGFLLLLTYVLRQRYLHPLSNFRGPFIASITNAWKSYYTYRLRLHDELTELHKYYGPVVRVGPNDLHFQEPEAIAPIYKAGRKMPKTEFYDSFTTFNPNLFGTQDDDVHAIRRRQMAYAFSQKNISDMEPILDEQLGILCDKIASCAKGDKTFDLKDFIARYVLDILGEVAFSHSFESQGYARNGSEDIPTAINDHILLACIIGQMPFQSLSKLIAAWSPISWMRRVVKSRGYLKSTCSRCVSNRIRNPSDRKDLLGALIKAKDPETGAELTELDINTEAFAMLVAGSHTTSGTLSLLFWELMHHPKAMSTISAELEEKIGKIPSGNRVHQNDNLESTLTYTRACVRENFRKNPVFTMALWREVNSPEGAFIAGYYVPHGTRVAASNYVLHHDASVWGPDHDKFDPQRWFDDRANGKENLLLPFSVGHRMCIGRNLAMTNIFKTTATILTLFELEPVDHEKRPNLVFRSSGIGEMEGTLLCRAKLRP